MKKGILIGVLALVLVAAGVLTACGTHKQDAQAQIPTEATAPKEETQPTVREEETQPTEPNYAPDFTVYDADGNEVHLSDFRGKPVVLNFWATWCGPCKMEMPHFEEVYLEQGDEIQFVMVNLTNNGETVEGVQTFLQEQGYTFPVFYDTQMDAAMVYGIYSIPTTIFIDAEGVGIAQATGAIDKETLQKGIDMITE